MKLEQENANSKMTNTIDQNEYLKKEYQTQIKLLSEANDSIIKELKNMKADKSKLEKELANMMIEMKTQSHMEY